MLNPGHSSRLTHIRASCNSTYMQESTYKMSRLTHIRASCYSYVYMWHIFYCDVTYHFVHHDKTQFYCFTSKISNFFTEILSMSKHSSNNYNFALLAIAFIKLMWTQFRYIIKIPNYSYKNITKLIINLTAITYWLDKYINFSIF